MSSLYFADASSNPFENSRDETSNTFMLPICLSNRMVTGVFTSVSTLARTQGIEQSTPYTLLFSPGNHTYVFSVHHGTYVTYGSYTWSLSTNNRASAGGGQDTSQSILSLIPTARSKAGDPTMYMVDPSEVVSGMVLAKDRNVATFSSPLGIATFDIAPLHV